MSKTLKRIAKKIARETLQAADAVVETTQRFFEASVDAVQTGYRYADRLTVGALPGGETPREGRARIKRNFRVITGRAPPRNNLAAPTAAATEAFRSVYNVADTLALGTLPGGAFEGYAGFDENVAGGFLPGGDEPDVEGLFETPLGAAAAVLIGMALLRS